MDSKQTQLGGPNVGPGTMGGHDVRSADEIARGIAARRAEMSVLADELEQRLAPKQIASEVSHAVKKQLQSRTHRAASAVAGSVRRDPFPWLLMGLGAAWLVKDRRDRTSAQRYGAVKRGAGRSELLGVSSYGSMGYGATAGSALPETSHPMESPSAPVSGLSDTGLGGGLGSAQAYGSHEERGGVAGKAHDVREKVADKAHAAKERVAETAHEVREKVSSTVTSAQQNAQLAKQRAAEKARRARMQLERQYDSSPLLLGLAALLGGVALGAALPATRKEEELLGPVRDRLLDQVREGGREMAGKVTRVAEAAVHTAVDQLEREPSSDDLARLAASAAQAGKEAAKQEAERQGLGGSGHGDGHASGGDGQARGGDGRHDDGFTSGPSGSSQGPSMSRGGGSFQGTGSSFSSSGAGMRATGAGGGSAMPPSSGGATRAGGSGGGPLVPPGGGGSGRGDQDRRG